MTDVFFKRLHPANITPDMLALIEESKQWDPDKTATEEILALVVEGKAQLWYFNRGTDHAIMITQILTDEGEQAPHVYIWRLFGKGLLPVYDYVEGQLMKFAREQGASSIQTSTHQRGEEVLCSRGFTKVVDNDETALIKEVCHG
jgi:hypothetical protein